MGFIAGFFRWLWTLARVFWSLAGSGQMFRGAGTLWTFLFFLLCIVFAVTWVFGVSPPELSAWFYVHGATWNRIGGGLWRLFWGAVLGLCGLILFAVGLEFFGARATDAKDTLRDVNGGCCGLMFVVVVGYIAWTAITMPLD